MLAERSVLLVYAYAMLMAAALASFLVPTCIRLAQRFNVLDFPAERKVHEVPIPLLGGLAMFGAFITTIVVNVAVLRWLVLNTDLFEYFPSDVAGVFYGTASGERLFLASVILVGAGMIVAIGLLDDMLDVRPLYRILVQTVAASLVVAAGVSPTYLGMPSWMSAVVTVLWIVVVTNSFNLIDSLDGLSAGVGAICAISLAATMHYAGQPLVAIFSLVLAGSALGFLRYNRSPARIFMGSTGSLFLGYTVSVAVALGISVTPSQSTVVSIAIPFLVLGVPLYDTLSVIFLRIRAGEDIFTADRRHLAHRMMEFGFNHREAVLVVYLMAIVGSGTTPLLVRASLGEAILVMFQITCTFGLIIALEWGAVRARARTLSFQSSQMKGIGRLTEGLTVDMSVLDVNVVGDPVAGERLADETLRIAVGGVRQVGPGGGGGDG